MRTFHDVIRELLDRLRHYPTSSGQRPNAAARFIAPAPEQVPPVRSLYRAEAATWGQDGGYDPAHMPLPSGFETRVMPSPPKMPVAPARPASINAFRLFED